MVKDRLPEFQEKVQKSDDGESISLIHYFSIIDMEAPFMGDFFHRLNILRNTIGQIAELVDQADDLHRIMLVSDATPGIKEQLEDIMVEIKKLGTDVRIKLQQMKQMQEWDKLRNRKNVQQRIIDAQIDASIKCFCTAMNRYYDSVVAHRENCKVRLVRQLEIANIKRTDAEVEEILHQGHLTLFPEIIIELQEARQRFKEIESRHGDLSTLEDGLEQLRDMFLDLAYLLCAQDERIHSIEEETSLAEDGIEQIGKLTYARKSSGFFPSKLSQKKYLTSMGSILSRLFSSCWRIRRASYS